MLHPETHYHGVLASAVTWAARFQPQPVAVQRGLYLEEGLLLGRIEARPLLDAGVALEEGAGGDAARHPLNRNHGAVLREERRVALLRDEGGFDTCKHARA